MAMNENRYIAEQPDGAWVVVYDGNVSYYDSQAEAENLFRSLEQESAYSSPVTPASTTGYSGGAGAYYGGGYTSGGGGMPIVGGTGQLDQTTALMNQEYLRQRLKELELPGLDIQRRDEILAELNAMANQTGYVDPNWQAMLNAVNITGGTSGGAATGATGAATQTAGAQGSYKQMEDWSVNYYNKYGRWPSREEWVSQHSLTSGLTADQSGQLYDRANEYYKLNKSHNPGEATWNSWLNQIAPTKTMDQKRYEEAQRQFDASQGQQNQQYWAGLLSSLRGPQDWLSYQRAQSMLPAGADANNLMDIFNATPSFGAVKSTGNWTDTVNQWMQRHPEVGLGNQQGQPGGGSSTQGSTEQPFTAAVMPRSYANRANQGRMLEGEIVPTGGIGSGGQQPTEQPDMGIGNPVGQGQQGGLQQWTGQFTQPAQIRPDQYRKLRPTQRAMLEGEWGENMLDPSDQWDIMRRSWNTGGNVNRNIRFR